MLAALAIVGAGIQQAKEGEEAPYVGRVGAGFLLLLPMLLLCGFGVLPRAHHLLLLLLLLLLLVVVLVLDALKLLAIRVFAEPTLGIYGARVGECIGVWPRPWAARSPLPQL
jgi:hypothetical protein